MAGLLDGASDAAPNVVLFRPVVTDQHRDYLERWMRAGRRMGLHDSQIYQGRSRDEPQGDYIVVWVRENADPAYVIAAAGATWVVTDTIHDVALGTFCTIQTALQFIRPVLSLGVAAILAEQLI